MINAFDLNLYAISRPEKIKWTFQTTNDVLGKIKSKSLRTFLKRADVLMQERNIRWEYSIMTKEEFLAWLPFYKEKMEENDFDIFAYPEWWDIKQTEGKIVEKIFFFMDEKLVGTTLFTRKGTETASLCFKASDHVNIFPGGRGSLGAIIDYYYLKLMCEKQVKDINGGRTRNMFGVTHTLGYLDSRLRIGFNAAPAKDTDFLDSVSLNEEGIVLFFGLQNEKFCLFGVKPKGSEFIFEQARFNSPELPFVQIEY